LKAIDGALYDYGHKKNPHNQYALFKAVRDWIKGKGTNWKASTRNSKIERAGMGTVEVLLDDLFLLQPAYRLELAGYLGSAKLPAPKLMQYGALNSQADEDGHWYEIPVQSEESSCGPCSMRIVIKLVQNESVSEEYLQELVEFAEEGQGFQGSLGKGGVMARGGVHDWSVTGSGSWLIPEALAAAKIPNSTGTEPSHLLRVTPKQPAIGVVEWSNGGLHYVVAARKNRSGDKLVILDAYYGVQHVDITNNALSDYEPRDSSGQVLARGAWYPWVCAVTARR
jgi:hypothetical protein